MIYKENLEKMRTNMQERIKFVRKEISGSSPGYLLKTKHDQRDEYIHMFYKKGRRVRKRVKPGSETAENLLRKMILEIELETLEKNYRHICSIAEKYIAFSTEFAIEQLPENLREDYRKILLTESKKTEAGVGPNQSDFMKEGRTHISSRGLSVRSKSELIIVEKLYEYGLAFRYEEVKVLEPESCSGRRRNKSKTSCLTYTPRGYIIYTADKEYILKRREKIYGR